MSVVSLSSVLAPLVLVGYCTAEEADAVKTRLHGQVAPPRPSEVAAVIASVLAAIRSEQAS